LPALYRYRRDVLSLDSVQFLTRGSPLRPSMMLFGLHPERDSYTGITTGQPALVGQMHYIQGDRSARLSFVLPHSACAQSSLTDLLEGLSWRAGEWGALHLLADVDERSQAFEGMRRAGFGIYAWQNVWRMSPRCPNGRSPGVWQRINEGDELAVRSLYQQLVPPLVQSAEPPPSGRLHGLVYRRRGEVLAYVDGVFGPQGIYLHPLVHPELENVVDLLRDLTQHLPGPSRRPVYVAVRSYQAWLQSALEQLEGEVAPRQALMIKHLTVQQRVPALNPRLSVLENRRTEPTAPIVNPFDPSDPLTADAIYGERR